jgi:hypothetical protein
MKNITQEQGNELSRDLAGLATRIREEGIDSLPPHQVTVLFAAVKLGGKDTPPFKKTPLRKEWQHHPAHRN